MVLTDFVWKKCFNYVRIAGALHQCFAFKQMEMRMFVGGFSGENFRSMERLCAWTDIWLYPHCYLSISGLKYPTESPFVKRLRELEKTQDTQSIPLIPSTPEEMEEMLKLCSFVRFKIPQQVICLCFPHSLPSVVLSCWSFVQLCIKCQLMTVLSR